MLQKSVLFTSQAERENPSDLEGHIAREPEMG